ncbi:MmcQ/YjbR family DNA-binding protein [Bacteroidota bacterium]
MNFDTIREYCLKKKGVTEGFPFDEETLVFKVMGKMFALTNLTPPRIINLKCDPERAIELREEHENIRPGWHMNKKHWNTLDLEGRLKTTLIKDLIDHSYQLVVEGLPKKEKEKLEKIK